MRLSWFESRKTAWRLKTRCWVVFSRRRPSPSSFWSSRRFLRGWWLSCACLHSTHIRGYGWGRSHVTRPSRPCRRPLDPGSRAHRSHPLSPCHERFSHRLAVLRSRLAWGRLCWCGRGQGRHSGCWYYFYTVYIYGYECVAVLLAAPRHGSS